MTPRRVKATLYDHWNTGTRRYEERGFDGLLIEIFAEHETYPANEYETTWTGLRTNYVGVVIEKDVGIYRAVPLGQLVDIR